METETGRINLGIVIPAYNEAGRVEPVIRAIPQRIEGVDRVLVIVADDGSSDATATVSRRAGAIVVRHRVNLGAGAALRTGTEAAIRLGADIVVHMDADGQHPAQDLERLLIPLYKGADVVTGIRALRRPMPLLFILGNQALSVALLALFRIRNPDTQCAYRAFWTRCWPSLRWRSPDYAFASEMLIRGHRLRWETVPIATIYTDRYKGTGMSDGLRILTKMLAWRIRAGG